MTITVNLDFGKREIENFQELEKTIYRTVLQFGREITAKALESMDEQLLDSRDVRRFRCKGFQKTSIKTIMGPVEFERRVYVDNAAVEGQHCVHLLDDALELNQIGLVTENVCKLAASEYKEKFVLFPYAHECIIILLWFRLPFSTKISNFTDNLALVF